MFWKCCPLNVRPGCPKQRHGCTMGMDGVGSQGSVPLSSTLCAQLHFCKTQKATLHQVTCKVLQLTGVICNCGGVVGFFFTFSANAPILFGMPKVVGMDLSNFLSNQCLVSEMSFVGSHRKLHSIVHCGDLANLI